MSTGEVLRRQSYAASPFDVDPTYSLLKSVSLHGDRTSTKFGSSNMLSTPVMKHALPAYLRPLPPRMTSADIDYLFAKGALHLPDAHVRNALIQSYLQYVHPYMPLIEVHEFLQIIEDGTGASGKLSLLLFQAVMFAGTAFVDMKYLRSAGYTNRKVARKSFFQKARVRILYLLLLPCVELGC